MNQTRLKDITKENNLPAFRFKQLSKAIFQDGVFCFAEISTLPKELRQKLDETEKVLCFDIVRVLEAKDKLSFKALLKLKDGYKIETVLMSVKPGFWSVCVSSQVGCPLGCAFCATGAMGFKRNLTSEEITDQILFWKQSIKKIQISNDKIQINSKFEIRNSKFTIVYMGMGEPFLNWENVSQSIKDLTNPELFAFGSRSISVSTAGIPAGIEKLAEEFPQINLAISLHFSTDEERSKFMPINKKYNLDELRSALKDYFRKCNRKVFLEYIMLENINDSLDEADNLIKFIQSIGPLQLLHVNLIRYNSTFETLIPSEAGVVREFKDYLARHGISVTIRKSLGSEIQGACGQLAGK